MAIKKLVLDPISADSNAASVTATLRQKILNGDFSPGVRLAEIPVAQILGVSRTPVRLAIRTLAEEGLLEPVGARGYAVRAISDRDVRCAIEVRGVLEGLAARHLAERGLTDVERGALREALAEGDAVLAKGRLDPEDIERWSALNARFHGVLVGSHPSRVIADAIARNDHLPFASASSIVIDPRALAGEFRKIQIAQLHHQLVLEALENRESARVEMLMREHAWVGFRYGRWFGLEAQRFGPEAESEPLDARGRHPSAPRTRGHAGRRSRDGQSPEAIWPHGNDPP